MTRSGRIVFALFLFLQFSCGGRKEPSISAPQGQLSSLELLSETVLSIPEPSGLAFNPRTNSLYTVSDANGIIYEITLSGSIIRQMQVEKNDLEGITFSGNFDTIFVAEEATYQVVGYSLAGEHLSSWKVVTSGDTKSGYEGVTKLPSGGFVVINEKTPVLALETDKSGKEISRKELGHTTDLSDICYDGALNCFWLVSHESKKILKLNMEFGLMKSWDIDVQQAEGIAVTSDRLYIVSDSDSKFFIYKKPG